MTILVLNDGTKIKINSMYDETYMQVSDMSFDELDKAVTKEGNLNKIIFTTEDGRKLSEYTNLKLISISRYYVNNVLILSLRQI